jgi:hypothetical protein
VVDDPLGGRHPYRVTSRRAYPKSDLPAELFTATGRSHLVLVTCGGAFDEATRRYADNVVVVADPA